MVAKLKPKLARRLANARSMPARRLGKRMPEHDEWPKCDLCIQRKEEYAAYVERCRIAKREPERPAPPLRPFKWMVDMSDKGYKRSDRKLLCTQHLYVAEIVVGPLHFERYDLYEGGYNLNQAGREMAAGRRLKFPPGVFWHEHNGRRYDPRKGPALTPDGENLNEDAWIPLRLWVNGEYKEDEKD